MHPLDFLRVTAASTPVEIANPTANRLMIERAITQLHASDVIIFAELCLSGYSCGDLFSHRALLDSCAQELKLLSKSVGQQLVVIGMPLQVMGRVYNVAAVLCNRRILGFVPKQHLPNYQEFYETRWFHSGAKAKISSILYDEFGEVPFGVDLLFSCGNATIGIEICEDLWVPSPPSSMQAIAGANVLLNLSASNETVAKGNYRKQLALTQSGRCIAAYAYASAGPTESTTDLVFSGHCLICENGNLLAESKRIGTGLALKPDSLADGLASYATVDIDLDRLNHDRRVQQTVHQVVDDELQKPFRRIPFELRFAARPLQRPIDPYPFVPRSTTELEARCNEVFEIQCASLAKRVSRLSLDTPLVVGVSGGLDSTLALIVAVKMCDLVGWSRERIMGMTMPGFGTSEHTLQNAQRLMAQLGVRCETVDIRESCFRIFESLNHKPFGSEIGEHTIESLQSSLEALPESARQDLVFENVQARMRTLMLMSRGFVLGTGDLSEMALGWSTYNADHISMYNVNCSVPKTLVKFLVQYVASHHYEGETQQTLLSIVDTPISPELLPLSTERKTQQSTESVLGPYELHDFFLYHFVRGGASPKKMLLLAEHAKFSKPYVEREIETVLQTFLKRFFAAQYKRSCTPDGPKVGSVSLSPRGDWRMPSDADSRNWHW